VTLPVLSFYILAAEGAEVWLFLYRILVRFDF